jgi:hypothetical protein
MNQGPITELHIADVIYEHEDAIVFDGSSLSALQASAEPCIVFYLTQEDEKNGYGTVIRLDPETKQAAIFADLNPEYTYLFYHDEQKQLQTLLWCIEFATRTPEGLYLAHAKVHGRGLTPEELAKISGATASEQPAAPQHQLSEAYAPVNPATEVSANQPSAFPAQSLPTPPSPQPLPPSPPVAPSPPAMPASPAPASQAPQAQSAAVATPPPVTWKPQYDNQLAYTPSSAQEPLPAAPAPSAFPDAPPVSPISAPVAPPAPPVTTVAAAATESTTPALATPTETPSSSMPPAAQPNLASGLPPMPPAPPTPTAPPPPQSWTPNPNPTAPVATDTSATSQPTDQASKMPVGRPPKPLIQEQTWLIDANDFTWIKTISRDPIGPNQEALRQKVLQQVQRNQPDILSDWHLTSAFEQAYLALCQTYDLVPSSRHEILKGLMNGKIIKQLQQSVAAGQ